MSIKKAALLIVTHGVVGVLGFAIGIYALPILIAPPAPSAEEILSISPQAEYSGEFRRDLQDSDALHWGEGKVLVSRQMIAHVGRLAPGPDYRLYLSPEFVETEADFKRLKGGMVQAGEVKTFENFIVQIPAGVKPENFTTVIVWCESFGEFITAAKYR